jgi:hypothetical protein
MSLSVIIQIYNNITTLERFKGRNVKVPCWGPVHESKTIPNEYDMIWLSNTKQVLGKRIWMWLLPISEEMKGQGFFYPKIPEITMSDMNMLLKDTGKAHNTSFNANEFDYDPKDYI